MAVCFDQPWTILISLICIDHSERFRANVHNKVSGGFYGDAWEVMVLHGHHLTEPLHVWHIGLPSKGCPRLHLNQVTKLLIRPIELHGVKIDPKHFWRDRKISRYLGPPSLPDLSSIPMLSCNRIWQWSSPVPPDSSTKPLGLPALDQPVKTSWLYSLRPSMNHCHEKGQTIVERRSGYKIIKQNVPGGLFFSDN